MRKKILLSISLSLMVLLFVSSSSDYVYVKVAPGFIRKSPRLTSEVIDTVAEGTKLKVYEEKKPWYKVENEKTKKVGWIHESAFVFQKYQKTTTPSGQTKTYSEAEAYLATKAFNDRVESHYRKRGSGNYSSLTQMENIRISLNELIRFIEEGNLNK